MNNYHNNRNRGNNNQRLDNIHEEVKKAKNNLPYTFVPVNNKSQVETVTAAKFNETQKGDEKLFSGHLNCSMYALNYLLVGNEHSDPEENRARIANRFDENFKSTYKQTKIMPLKINNNIYISPYTLKGCIANFLAAYLEIPMRKDRVNPQRFLFRPNINFNSTSKIKLGVGMILFPHDDYVTFSHFTALGDRNTPVIYSCKENSETYSEFRNGNFCRKKISKKITYNDRNKRHRCDDYGDECTMLCLPYVNGLDGHATFAKLFTNNPRRVKQHNCLYIDEEVVTFTGNQFMIKAPYKQFKATYKVLEDDHLNNHPLLHNKQGELKKIKQNISSLKTLKQGDIIFYEYEEKNANGKLVIDVKTFGKTYYYPWAYDKGIHDFSDDIRNMTKENISIMEEMFGYSFEEKKINIAKSGKIHFNFAKYTGGGEFHNGDFVLPRPGDPKPSSYEFYLQQSANVKEPNTLNCFGEPLRDGSNSKLSGRKFYKASSIMPASINLSSLRTLEDKKYLVLLNSMLKPKDGSLPEFKLRVNFENLTEVELKLLVLALTLDKTSKNGLTTNKQILCHQIGYGKNYGMGAVKTFIENSEIYCDKEFKPEKLSEFFDEKMIESISKNESLLDSIKLHHKKFNYPLQYGINGRRYYQNVDKDGNPREQSIPNWHTNIRKIDLENRREQ